LKQLEQENGSLTSLNQHQNAKTALASVLYQQPNAISDSQRTANFSKKAFVETINNSSHPSGSSSSNDKQKLHMLLIDIIKKKNDLIKQLQEIEKQVIYRSFGAYIFFSLKHDRFVL
jgi:hypothetical protein